MPLLISRANPVTCHSSRVHTPQCPFASESYLRPDELHEGVPKACHNQLPSFMSSWNGRAYAFVDARGAETSDEFGGLMSRAGPKEISTCHQEFLGAGERDAPCNSIRS